MRPLFALFVAVSLVGVLAAPAAAQVPAPPRLEPIPEPPPPRIGVDRDVGLDGGVRLTPGADERVEETIIDGRRTIHVINPNGTEYYLQEDLGDGTVSGQSAHDSRVRVPRWVILRF